MAIFLKFPSLCLSISRTCFTRRKANSWAEFLYLQRRFGSSSVLFLIYKEWAVLSRLSSHCIKSRWINAFSKHLCFCCPKGFIWTKCTADGLRIDFEPPFFLFLSHNWWYMDILCKGKEGVWGAVWNYIWSWFFQDFSIGKNVPTLNSWAPFYGKS